MDKPDIYGLIMDMGATAQITAENLAKSGENFTKELQALQLMQTAAMEALHMLPEPD